MCGLQEFASVSNKYSKLKIRGIDQILIIYLALINRAEGRRILTEVESIDRSGEVCTHDRDHDSPIQTDLRRSRRCLLYGKNKKKCNSYNVTGLH